MCGALDCSLCLYPPLCFRQSGAACYVRDNGSILNTSSSHTKLSCLLATLNPALPGSITTHTHTHLHPTTTAILDQTCCVRAHFHLSHLFIRSSGTFDHFCPVTVTYTQTCTEKLEHYSSVTIFMFFFCEINIIFSNLNKKINV